MISNTLLPPAQYWSWDDSRGEMSTNVHFMGPHTLIGDNPAVVQYPPVGALTRTEFGQESARLSDVTQLG